MYRIKIIRLVLPFLLLAIVVPIVIDWLIFGNTFPSNIDNSSWASFLGSFLGAIIGGGCTCWAVVIQKKYGDDQKRIDEVAAIRPYIVAVNPMVKKSSGKIDMHFELQNQIFESNPSYGKDMFISKGLVANIRPSEKNYKGCKTF